MVPGLKYKIENGCPIEKPIKEPAYEGDVGYDLGVAIPDATMELEPHGFRDIPTYVRVELPPGVWGDIRPRSSTYARRRLVVMPGTIDNGYRGLLSVFVYNPNPNPVQIIKGDYLAQLVLCPIVAPPLIATTEMAPSTRGEKGFGSSGGFTTVLDSRLSHEPVREVLPEFKICGNIGKLASAGITYRIEQGSYAYRCIDCGAVLSDLYIQQNRTIPAH